jgi:transcriptional regulator with PAS, ATPase and Fis domain
LTWADVQIRQCDYHSGVRVLDAALALAVEAGDDLLMALARIKKAKILATLGHETEAARIIDDVARDLPKQEPEVFAQYESAIALLSSTAATAKQHYLRAERIFSGLHNVPGLLEVTQLRNQIELDPDEDSDLAPADGKSRWGLQEIASLMIHVGRAEVLATSVMAILSRTRCVAGARAVVRSEAGATEVLASYGTLEDGKENRALLIGTSSSRSFEVLLQPLPDVESRVTLNALATLLGTIRELETARTEREDRLTLWPADELTDNEDGAAATGTMGMVMATVRRVAPVNVLVLITGESGTGKEVLARSIHRASPRAAKPFVPFNCAAVPRELLESQLFGHRRGAFTGAERDSPGVIRAARDGTLFLDEIGELGLDLQPKLLRFLESSEINPLGESTPFRVDVRIVAATNANLDDLVHQGKFREDLFYRLNVIRLSIPPLRERREEIPALVHHFIARAATEFNKGRMRIAEEAMEHLLLFRWPGNVRQLQNEIRRMVALADPDSVLRPSMIDPLILRATPKASPPPETPDMAVSLHDNLPATITRIEREMIERALKAHDGKVDAVARALGISRKGLYLKRQRLGL